MPISFKYGGQPLIWMAWVGFLLDPSMHFFFCKIQRLYTLFLSYQFSFAFFPRNLLLSGSVFYYYMSFTCTLVSQRLAQSPNFHGCTVQGPVFHAIQTVWSPPGFGRPWAERAASYGPNWEKGRRVTGPGAGRRKGRREMGGGKRPGDGWTARRCAVAAGHRAGTVQGGSRPRW